MQLPPKALLIVLLTLPVAGCYESTGCGSCGWLSLFEVEPNDLPHQANWLGDLYPEDALAIDGRITQFGPDLLDGFALRSGAPIHVQFALWADQPGADLDVCLYDPDLGQYIACWETSAHPETGAFTIWGAGKEVHLVVSSYLGDSSYRFEVQVYSACCPDGPAPAAIETDTLAGPHRLGTEERWARYAAQARAEAAAAPRSVVPGELIEIDLESGELRRRPLVLEPLGMR